MLISQLGSKLVMATKRIIIVDYKLGNLFSVNQALLNIGLNAEISSNPKEILSADALVLPGVGAFRDAMSNLNYLNLIRPIIASVEAGKPFLGICLGLQLLFSESEEFGMTKGLGLVKGLVKRFSNTVSNGQTRKVPQIGWNRIYCVNGGSWNNGPLRSIREGAFMYFVHSYYVEPEELVGLSQTNYEGQVYISSILKENIFACQFHPEKSAVEGLKIYDTWAELNNLK